jgi:hypothetical protein
VAQRAPYRRVSRPPNSGVWQSIEPPRHVSPGGAAIQRHRPRPVRPPAGRSVPRLRAPTPVARFEAFRPYRPAADTATMGPGEHNGQPPNQADALKAAGDTLDRVVSPSCPITHDIIQSLLADDD